MTAAALADAAGLLRAAGRAHEARAHAEAAVACCTACGADADAARISAQHRLARSAAPRARFGFDALTPTERRVIDLVADGLSNVDIARRLYVSRRTVESHVSSAYRKLEVPSRVELAKAALAQRVE
jgi:DNA-binding NarL/FixJ family response regulator